MEFSTIICNLLTLWLDNVIALLRHVSLTFYLFIIFDSYKKFKIDRNRNAEWRKKQKKLLLQSYFVKLDNLSLENEVTIESCENVKKTFYQKTAESNFPNKNRKKTNI